MNQLRITYRFDVGDESKVFRVTLDPDTLLQIEPPSADLPGWTRLGFHQCPGCPLSRESDPKCPVAVNLIPLIEQCGGLSSFGQARIVVTTQERSYSADTTLQRGLSSLLGLLMATSACPDMTFLRPMARFHLPFATEEETTYRAISSYLMRQYYQHKSGKPPDLDLVGLRRSYYRLQIVNRAFAKRLKAACEQDAAVNAVVLLDLFAKEIPYGIDEKLDELRYLFSP